MSSSAGRKVLLERQYRDASNLEARIALHARFGANLCPWHKWAFDHLGLPDEARILELGCGAGQLWLENADRIPPGWEIMLSDFSPGMLDDARRNLSGIRRLFGFIRIDAQDIPVEDNSIDAVIANHMLYHVPDRARALREVARVLRPSGRFYCATNGAEHMRELMDLCGRLGAPMAREALAFTLESGADELLRWFGSVQLAEYPDRLHVTEAEPLVKWTLSLPAAAALSDEQVQAIRSAIEREIAYKGALDITKSSGMFIACGAHNA